MGPQADEVFPLSPPKKIASIYTPDLALGTEGEQRGEISVLGYLVLRELGRFPIGQFDSSQWQVFCLLK